MTSLLLRAAALLICLTTIAQAQTGFRWVVEPRFEDASSAHGGVVPVKEGGLWGFVGADGAWVVEPEFEKIQKGGNGRFPVFKDGAWGILNTQGQRVLSQRYDQIGLPGVLTPALRDGKWRALTLSGSSRFTFELDQFIGNDDFCITGKRGDRHVMIWMGDTPGIETLRGADRVFRPREGRVLFKSGARRDHTQCRSFAPSRAWVDEARSVSEGMAAVRKGKLWGYRPSFGSGREIAPQFAKARDFAEGLAPVQNAKGAWGYVNYQGKLVIPHRFDAAYGLSDGIAGIAMGDKRGFINARGQVVIAPQFEDFWRHADGLIPVKKNGLWGIIAPTETDVTRAFDLPLERLAGRSRAQAAAEVVPSVPHFYFGQDIQSRHDVSFSADASTMVTIVTAEVHRNPDWNRDGELALWDTATAKLIRKIKLPGLSQAIVLKEHNLIMAGTFAGDLQLLDPVTGDILYQKRAHAGGVRELALSPDGARIASLGGGKLRIWSAETGELITSIYSSETKLAFAADGGLWLANENGGMRQIRASGRVRKLQASSKLLQQRRSEAQLLLPDVALSSTGLLARLERGSVKQSDGYVTQNTLVLTDPDDERTLTLPKGFRDILSMAFSPDGAQLLIAGNQEDANRTSQAELRLYDTATLKLVKRWTAERLGAGFVTWFDRVAFDAEGRVIVIPGEGGEIRVMSPDLGDFVRDYGAPLALNVQGANHIEETTLYMVDTGGTVRVWDMESGALDALIRTPVGMGFENMMDFDGGKLFVRDGFEEAAVLIDPRSKAVRELTGAEARKVQARVSRTGGGPSGALARKLKALQQTLGTERIRGFASGDLAWAYTNDGRNEIYDTATGELIATFMANAQGDWVVLTPEGFFNASRNGGELLSVVTGFTAFSIEQAYQALYRPDLVRAKLAGDPGGVVRDAARRINLSTLAQSGAAPRVTFPRTRGAAPLSAAQTRFGVRITDQGGGIGRVEWRVNGIIADVTTPEASGQSRISLEAELYLDEGRNVIEVVAFNAQNLIASQPAEQVVQWDGTGAVQADPALHVLAIGVDEYLDSRLRLRFAVNDAKAISAAISAAGADLFADVHVTTLLDQEVTEARLESAFQAISERMAPQDVFVFFLAGHGKTLDGKYHFIPQDFRPAGSDPIRTGAISQDRWQDWLARIPARKAVLIYDTCESGSLTNQRGLGMAMEQSAAVQRLMRATGRTVLTASTDDAPALEGYKGHGVFTYALLEALGQADRNSNETIELTELAGYLDLRVPELSKAAFGHYQLPQISLTGSDFPVSRRYAALETPAAQSTAPQIPAAPTHVLAPGSGVLDAPGGAQTGASPEGAFQAVALIETDGAFARIARNGAPLGWVPLSALTPLN